MYFIRSLQSITNAKRVVKINVSYIRIIFSFNYSNYLFTYVNSIFMPLKIL